MIKPLVILFTAGTASAAVLPVTDLKRGTPVDFAKEVYPVLKQNCLACHNATKAKAGLNSIDPDVRFHLALLAAANNVFLTPFGIMIEAALTNMFEFTSTHNPQPDMFIPKHEGILKAVTRGNAKAARKAALSLLTDTDHTIAGVPARAKKLKKAKA